MKTKTTIKHMLLALTMIVGMASCKKDKKADPAPTPVQTVSIADLKKLSTGASVKAPDNSKITGIVISDVTSKNIDSKTVILQDVASQTGVIVTFDAAQTFALGDQLDVNISGQTLAQTNGEIILTNLPAANAKKTGTGTIAAKPVTIADVMTNKVAWDGTLVSLTATGLDGGNGKYTGSLTITDASGTIASNVLASAAFASTAYPVSVSSITGIVRVNGQTVSVDIRKTADVVSGAITKVIVEDFTNVSSPNSTTGYLGNMGGMGFTDAVGAWVNGTGNGGCWLFPGSKYDASFTTTGRSYLYMGFGTTDVDNYYNGRATMTANIPNLKGLKQVSITFAGSNLSGNGALTGDSNFNYDVVPFNPATDYFQIGFDATGMGIPSLYNLSSKYTKAGQFYTFTFNVPTKDQMVAAGIDNATADDVIKHWEYFAIMNLSTRSAGKDYTDQTTAPIVIDKIVFGFGN